VILLQRANVANVVSTTLASLGTSSGPPDWEVYRHPSAKHPGADGRVDRDP